MSKAHLTRYYCRLLLGATGVIALFEFTLLGFPTRLATGNLIVLDRLFLVTVMAAFLVTPFVLYPLGGGARRQELGTKLVFWSVPISGFVFAVLLWNWNKELPPGATPSVIMISGILATMGWLITQRNGRNAAKKQHTMNLLMDFTTSDFIRFHGTNVARTYPFNTQVPEADIADLKAKRTNWKPASGDSKSDMPTLTSIVHLLNFYEFVAIGVLRGDLDEPMTKELLRSVICSICIKYASYIRERQADGVGSGGNRAFIGLTTLFQEWATVDERDKANFVPADRSWRHLRTFESQRLGLRFDISKC